MTSHLSKRTAWTIALASCAVLLAVAIPMSLSSGEAAAKSSAEKFSMVGTWTGHVERVRSTDGPAIGTATLTVTEETGLTFTGALSWSTPDGDFSDPFVGAFTPGGALIYGGDQEGFYQFNLVNDETLDYCYVESGDTQLAACARLKKQK